MKLKKKSQSIVKKLGAGLIILILAEFTWAVYRYGNFNIFGSPHRVMLHGFRFDNDNDIVTLKGKDKPSHEVSTTLDRLTSKRIYSVEEDFKADWGKRVFMHVKDDEYIRLHSGGGA